MSTIFKEIYNLEKENKTFAVATIISAKGSTPREKAKMIIFENGNTISTIGGGPLEAHVIEEAKHCIKESINSIVSYKLDKNNNKASISTSKGIEEIDMLCGGEVDIFIEVVMSKERIVLIGGGHVSKAIADNLDILAIKYIVVDTREEFTNRERFQNASEIFIDTTFINAIKKIKFEKSDIVIIATHNSDEEALINTINKDINFIGMIGSKRKVLTIIKNLIDKKITSIENLQKLNAPLGIDIGAETPEQIALSIISLIQAKIKNKYIKNMSLYDYKKTVIVRGAGDIASGIIIALKKAGYNIIALEIEYPTVIRRLVSFASAIYESKTEIENIKAVKTDSVEEAFVKMLEGNVALLIDKEMESIKQLKPFILIDATVSKKNMGLKNTLAPITIALGPGFNAGVDCHYVIETNRGHTLGMVIENGYAQSNTAIPGEIAGESINRLLKTPIDGIIKTKKNITDIVDVQESVAVVIDNNGNEHEIKAQITGCIRGLLKDGLKVYKDMKVGDIDPRKNISYCTTVSEKARLLGNAVLSLLVSIER